MASNGERLRAWRKLNDLSQTEAAERFGVPQGTWAPWETGKKSPDRENAPKLESFTDGKVKASDWPSRKRRIARTRPITTSHRRTGTDG